MPELIIINTLIIINWFEWYYTNWLIATLLAENSQLWLLLNRYKLWQGMSDDLTWPYDLTLFPPSQ